MLGETGLVSVNLIKSGPPFCTLHIVHCTLIGFRQGRVAKRNDAFAVRFCLRLRVVRVAIFTALAGNQCTIPFCRKRVALDREGGRHR